MVTTAITIAMLLEDSGNLSSQRQVNTYQLALSLHKFVFEKGHVLDAGVEKWLNEKCLKPLAMAIQSLGHLASDKVSTAYRLISESLEENKRRTPRRSRQKSSEQVAVAV